MSDWPIVDFYRFVSEQVVDLTPFGAKDGTCWIVPRYEGWLAALILCDFPRGQWKSVVDDAEFIHSRIRARGGRGKYYGLDPADMYDPTDDPEG